MRTFVRWVVVLVLLTSAALTQQPQIPVLHSQNSYGFSLNDDKQLTFDTEYTRYTPIGGWFSETPVGGGQASEVLEERFHSHDHGGECCWTQMSITRLRFVVGKDKAYRAVWKIKNVLADKGEINGPFYRTLLHGCCGDTPTYTYFGLDTGKEIYESVVPVLKITVATTQSKWDRYIGAHQILNEKENVAVIQYGTSDAVQHEYWLTAPLDVYQLDAIRFVVDEKIKIFKLYDVHNEDEEPWLESWSKDADPMGGFAFEVVFRTHPKIIIPVEHDQLAIGKAQMPDGYAIRELAPKK